MSTNQPTLLSKTDVCSHLGLSPRCLEMMVKANKFPPSVRLGKCVYWSHVAVTRWQQQAFSEQEQWQPRPHTHRY